MTPSSCFAVWTEISGRAQVTTLFFCWEASADGITFYQVRSWRDTAHLVIEAHAQQGVLIVDLIHQIERLKKLGPDRKLTRRVTALEKRLTRMSDPGNP